MTYSHDHFGGYCHLVRAGYPYCPGGARPRIIRFLSTDLIRVSDKKRAKLDQAKITVYEGDYERGDNFPPILVADCGEFFTVIDGRHRLQAQRNLGWPHVEVEVDTR